MAFSLEPGETLRKGLRLEMAGGLLSFLPFMFASSRTIRLTDRRLVVTDSYARGNEVTSDMPLASIIQVDVRFNRRRDIAARLLRASTMAFVAALVALALATVIFAGVRMVDRLIGGAAEAVDFDLVWSAYNDIVRPVYERLWDLADLSELVGFPLLLIGALLLFIYYRIGAESLVVAAGAGNVIAIPNGTEVKRVEDLHGNPLSRDELDSLTAELELARQELLHEQEESTGEQQESAGEETDSGQ